MQHQIYANTAKAVWLSGWLSASLDLSSGCVYRQKQRGEKSCIKYAELQWLQQFFIRTVLKCCMCSACLRLFIAKYSKWQITIVNNVGLCLLCVDLMGFNGPSLSRRLPQVSVYRLFGVRTSRQAPIMCSIGKIVRSSMLLYLNTAAHLEQSLNSPHLKSFTSHVFSLELELCLTAVCHAWIALLRWPWGLSTPQLQRTHAHKTSPLMWQHTRAANTTQTTVDVCPEQQRRWSVVVSIFCDLWS